MLLTLCPNCPQQTWWTLILGWDSTFQAPCYKDAPKTFLNLKKKKNKDRNKEKTKKEKPSVEPLNLEPQPSLTWPSTVTFCGCTLRDCEAFTLTKYVYRQKNINTCQRYCCYCGWSWAPDVAMLAQIQTEGWNNSSYPCIICFYSRWRYFIWAGTTTLESTEKVLSFGPRHLPQFIQQWAIINKWKQ